MANRREDIIKRSLSFRPTSPGVPSTASINSFDGAMLSIQASSKSSLGAITSYKARPPIRPPVIRPNYNTLSYNGEYLTYNNQFINFTQ